MWTVQLFIYFGILVDRPTSLFIKTFFNCSSKNGGVKDQFPPRGTLLLAQCHIIFLQNSCDNIN